MDSPEPSLDRATLVSLVTRATQVGAVLLSVGYVLGVMSIAGQLRVLGLHQPTVLSGFAHDDVLMKGIGVLAGHLASLVSLVLLALLALNDGARRWVHAALSPGSLARTRPVGERVGALLFQLAYAGLGAAAVLTASWWAGTVVVVLVYAYVAVAWRHERLMSPGGLLLTALVGALLIGSVGALVNPPPLPRATLVVGEERRVEGHLFGTGQRGEWYIVLDDTTRNHDRFEVIPDKQVVSMEMREPSDAPLTTWRRITDG